MQINKILFSFFNKNLIINFGFKHSKTRFLLYLKIEIERKWLQYNLKFSNTKVLFKSNDKFNALSCKEIKFKLSKFYNERLVFIEEKYILVRKRKIEVSQFKQANEPVSFKQGVWPYIYNNSK